MSKPVCVVSGVGPGLGAALVRRFSDGGYRVVALARRQAALEEATAGIPDVVPISCDATEAEAVARCFARIHAEVGPTACLLYNTGSGAWGPLADLTAAAFEGAWKANALGLFLASKQAVPKMVAAGEGVIGVTGASAALRGRARSLAFAAAKSAQRSIAQSLARDLGPQGIHVFYAQIDGMIDLPATREAMPDTPEEAFLSPTDIAEAYFTIAAQRRSAWSFELDLRPHCEQW